MLENKNAIVADHKYIMNLMYRYPIKYNIRWEYYF